MATLRATVSASWKSTSMVMPGPLTAGWHAKVFEGGTPTVAWHAVDTSFPNASLGKTSTEAFWAAWRVAGKSPTVDMAAETGPGATVTPSRVLNGDGKVLGSVAATV